MPYKLSASLAAHSSDVRLHALLTLLQLTNAFLERLSAMIVRGQVRAVASPTDNLVLSASRDKTAVSWTRETSASSFSENFRFQAGSKYINAVAYIPPSPAALQGATRNPFERARFPRAVEWLAERDAGYIATGGTETVINVYPLDSPSDEPRYSLVGHSDNVCALDASSALLISGSWDR